MQPEATIAAQATAAILLARTVSRLPIRSVVYKPYDGLHTRWNIPPSTPTSPAAI